MNHECGWILIKLNWQKQEVDQIWPKNFWKLLWAKMGTVLRWWIYLWGLGFLDTPWPLLIGGRSLNFMIKVSHLWVGVNSPWHSFKIKMLLNKECKSLEIPCSKNGILLFLLRFSSLKLCPRWFKDFYNVI